MNLPQEVSRSDENADAVKQTILAVHELVVRQLSEMHGETLRVNDANQFVEGNSSYTFLDAGSRCYCCVVPLNERAAAVSITVQIGRLYTGYRRALRWLASNRESNSVAFCYRDDLGARRELWVSSNRVTLPGDDKGIHEMLLDVRAELLRVRVGLGCYFPQLVGGAHLASMEEYAEKEKSEGMAAILAWPRGLLDAVEKDPELAGRVGLPLLIDVTSWLCEWEKHLQWIDRALAGESDGAPTPGERRDLLGHKVCALARLNRYEECLRLVEQLEAETDGSQLGNLTTIRCFALNGLGRHEDILETLRSATFDENPRVWFWRSIALARLGQIDEAVKAFMEYESKLGPDIIGRKELRRALPPEEAPKKEEGSEPELEIKL